MFVNRVVISCCFFFFKKKKNFHNEVWCANNSQDKTVSLVTGQAPSHHPRTGRPIREDERHHRQNEERGWRRKVKKWIICYSPSYILHLLFISDWVIDGCITLKFKVWLNDPNMEVKSTLFLIIVFSFVFVLYCLCVVLAPMCVFVSWRKREDGRWS